MQIWRCYNLWNSSVRVILLPCALLLIEIGNYPFNFASKYLDIHGTGASIANIVKISEDHLNPAIYRSGTALQIQTTMAIFSAFTLTLITTLLILYRIIAMTRRTNLPRQMRNTYKDIIDMIIQSAALYCVVLLIWAVSWAITPASTLSGSVRQIPFDYLSKIIEEVCFLVAVRRAPSFPLYLVH